MPAATTVSAARGAATLQNRHQRSHIPARPEEFCQAALSNAACARSFVMEATEQRETLARIEGLKRFLESEA